MPYGHQSRLVIGGRARRMGPELEQPREALTELFDRGQKCYLVGMQGSLGNVAITQGFPIEHTTNLNSTT